MQIHQRVGLEDVLIVDDDFATSITVQNGPDGDVFGISFVDGKLEVRTNGQLAIEPIMCNVTRIGRIDLYG